MPINRINQSNNRFSVTAAVDSVLKYLRNIRRQPISLQISIGAGSGCVCGYIFAKTSRLAALISGCSIILFQFMNYRGYLKFNRTQLQQDINELKDTFKAELGLEKPIIPTAKELDDFVTKNGYLFAGYIAGLLIGFGLA